MFHLSTDIICNKDFLVNDIFRNPMFAYLNVISTLIHFWLFFYIVDSYPMLYSIASANYIFSYCFARDILRVPELSVDIYTISIGLSLSLVILPLPPSFVSTINVNDLFQSNSFSYLHTSSHHSPMHQVCSPLKNQFCSKDPDNLPYFLVYKITF